MKLYYKHKQKSIKFFKKSRQKLLTYRADYDIIKNVIPNKTKRKNKWQNTKKWRAGIATEQNKNYEISSTQESPLLMILKSLICIKNDFLWNSRSNDREFFDRQILDKRLRGGGVKLRYKTKRKEFMTEKPVGRPIRVEKENKGIENLKKLKVWIKNNPKKSYGIIATVLVLIISLSVWSVIQNNIKKAEMQAKIEQEKAKIKKEESRDYFIKVEDVNTDCLSTFDSLTDSLRCNKIKISGEFSKYETVELRESFSSDNSLDINGGKFEKNKESSFGLYRFYSRDNYNPQDTNFFEEKITFEIFNKVLNKVVKSKTITIRYNLTDEDKKMFVNKFNEYKNKKQAEAEEQQRKQAEEKAIREKEWAEMKAKREKEEAERKNAEALKKQQEEAHKNLQNNGQELPSDILPEDIVALCEREIEDLGYKNASIDVSNQYAMGFPENIYVIVGKLSKKEKLFGSREHIGTVQCQANWKTWSLNSVMINGAKVY